MMASHIRWFPCATNYEHRMTYQSPSVTGLQEINGFYSRIAFTQMPLVSPSIITQHARACAQRHDGQKRPFSASHRGASHFNRLFLPYK
jgi:hypothetical protein